MLYRFLPLLILLVACTPPAVPSIQLNLSSQSLSVAQGRSSAEVPLTLERRGLQGAVNLSLEDAPAGVTARFTPNPAPDNQSGLVVEVGSTVAVRRYNLTIRAIGQGGSQTLPLALEVTQGPSFELSIPNPNLRLGQGRSLSVPLELTSNPILQTAVRLSLRGANDAQAPTGLQARFEGNTMTLEAAPDLLAGRYALEVRGEAEGVVRRAQLEVQVETAPGFALGLTPNRVNIRQGQSGASSVSLTRLNGFTGAVELSVQQADGSPLPAGITANLNPASANSNSLLLTLNVGANVEPREYALQLRGVSGDLTQRLPFTLTVLAPSDFMLSFGSAQASVRQGEEIEVPFTRENLGGFSAGVNLNLETPQGINARLENGQNGGGRVWVTVPLETPTGSYTLRLRGTSGNLTRTAELQVGVTAARGFRLIPAQPNVTLVRGQSARLTVNIERLNGFGNDPISFSLWNVTSGQTFSSTFSETFTPSPNTGNSVELTLDGRFASRPENLVMEIRAGSGGFNGRTASARFNLAVVDPPSFNLSASPASLNINPGQSLPIQIQITPRDGFTGNVELNLVKPSNLSSLFSEQFSPATTASSSTLTLTASASITPGYYNGMQIRAVAGSLSQVINLSVVVPSTGRTPISVRTLVAGSAANPTWAAYQDGNGAWQPLSGVAGVHSFSISDPRGRYGFVAVCPAASNGFRLVKTLYLTASEAPSLDLPCDSRTPNPYAIGNLGRGAGGNNQLSGTVTGLTTASPTAWVYGPNTSVQATLDSPTFTLEALPLGNINLLAARFQSSGLADRLLVWRNFDTRTASTFNINFNSASALPLSGTYTVSLSNSSSSAFIGVAAVLTAMGDDFGSGGALTPANVGGGASSLQYAGLTTPSAEISHVALASRGSGSGGSFSLRINRNPGNVSLTLLGSLSAVITPQGGNYQRFRVNWRGVSGQLFWSHFSQPVLAPRTSGITWSMFASPSWLNEAIDRSAELPNLSGLSGWQDSWGILNSYNGSVSSGAWVTNRTTPYLFLLDSPTLNSAVLAQLEDFNLNQASTAGSF